MECVVCGDPSVTLACPQCYGDHLRAYCDDACLRKDWLQHDCGTLRVGAESVSTTLTSFAKRLGGAVAPSKRRSSSKAQESEIGTPTTGSVQRLPICADGTVKRIAVSVPHPPVRLLVGEEYGTRVQFELAVRKTQKRTDDVCEFGTGVEYEFIRNFDFTARERKTLPGTIGALLPTFRKSLQGTKTITTQGKLEFTPGNVQFIDNALIYLGTYVSPSSGGALPPDSKGDVYKYMPNSHFQFVDQPADDNITYFFTLLVYPSIRAQSNRITENARFFQAAIPIRQIPYSVEDTPTRFLVNEQTGNGYAVLSLSASAFSADQEFILPRKGMTLDTRKSILTLKEVSVYFPAATVEQQGKRRR